jgi:HlyD family secretion protein
MKTVFAILILLGVAGGGAAYYAKHRTADPATSLRTAAVQRGDLLSTIGAKGTVEPEEVVDVGAQVAGLIVKFGTDPRDSTKLIDFGSVVEKGTVLARIDPTPYEAALDQAKANLQQAEGNQIQLDAKLYQAERDWSRAKKHCATNLRVGEVGRGGWEGNHRPDAGGSKNGRGELGLYDHHVSRPRRHHRPPREHRPDGRRQP